MENENDEEDAKYDTELEDIEDTVLDWDKVQVNSLESEELSPLEKLIGERLEEGDQIFVWDELKEEIQNNEVLAYKPVSKRMKPVSVPFPQDAAVTRTMPEDPLASLPELTRNPPEFTPSERISMEQMKGMDINDNNFLWPEEEKLFQHILKLNEATLAFDDSQRGNFRDDYFSPYIIPTIPHTPWVQKNSPIPPGIIDAVTEMFKQKIENGVMEICQSPYRSRWFCILKKNGKLRVVFDLQKLNSITIRDAGLPPILDSFVEPFAGYQCYTVFDMCSGFDARTVHPSSRDLTAVSTPLGLLRLTCLPQGFTNSPAEFQKCMQFILKDEIPHVANIFIDDLPIKGPKTQYLDANGNPETLKENPGIRRFIWEHACDVHRIMHRVKCAGVSFAPKKAQICRQEVVIIGQKCTSEGRLPEDDKVKKIVDWPIPKTTKEVRGFLGLCGTVRIWIKDFSLITRPLVALYKKGAEFIWTDECTQAFDTLKGLVSSPPALRPIDYSSDQPIIISVDTSQIAVGFILSQQDENGKRRPARYGSLPMNDREARYSQPKLELYGLYRALRHWRIHIIGVKKLIVEVDAKYIKGMLKEPDLQPNAAMNRWIQGILTFDFELVHVPATKFKGPDALSRRPMAETETIIEDNDEWLDRQVLLTQETDLEIPETVQVNALWMERMYEEMFAKQLEDAKPSMVLATLAEQEQTLHHILKYLITQQLPEFEFPNARQRFINNANKYKIHHNTMVKITPTGQMLTVILKEPDRQKILQQAHDDLGHRGIRTTFMLLKIRFFWPSMLQDIKVYVKSCHQCQVRSLKKYRIPITVSTPATLFSKIYIDVMHMPRVPGGPEGDFRLIVAARDDLTGACEARALRRATTEELADFFENQILLKYGMVQHVVTDNGSENQGEFRELLERLGLKHVTISGYNSRANGVVEKGHFTMREALIKSCEGDITKWPKKLQQVVFADWVTTSSVTGYSPYYLMYGQHPVLPFDLTEATFMINGYQDGLSTSELLALRVRQLEKRPEDIARAAESLKKHRCKTKAIMDLKYQHLFHKTEFKPGSLVLMRNSAIEKSMNKKSKPRYLGPFIVFRKTKRGAYVLKELDGTLMRGNVAAFRIAPYIARDAKALSKLAKYNPEVTDALTKELLEDMKQEAKAKRKRRKRKRMPNSSAEDSE
jgi:transposase InsO family protein